MKKVKGEGEGVIGKYLIRESVRKREVREREREKEIGERKVKERKKSFIPQILLSLSHPFTGLLNMEQWSV